MKPSCEDEDGIEDCPFCGGMTEVVVDPDGFYGVECIHCDYCSEHFGDQSDAVSAHDFVAKAVKKAKKEHGRGNERQ